ncbi:hypothetical protein THAOC_34652 [Thalassiosira oceanica]|uniref:MYND-type domain-containing protein n=1 Tax=Thalassiosira oceanica TaxID=159749 RepID=K0RC98_THAOC|nr:hypothetical protein THAOC_34652 [Thalassiosira oceanica]|eukprot:EJK46671.1 hypothetical protein THAOC_34652 [Thalassiosira oceanica]
MKMSGLRVDVCANCGIESGDAVKLKDCTACRLVKYCSVDCQRAHRKRHKKTCKQRAAELKDERLYGQGHERPEGDFCPICTLPIPMPIKNHSGFYICCMKRVCHGCVVAAAKRGIVDCPFCRTSAAALGDDALIPQLQKRADAKDPTALEALGEQYSYGKCGLEKDVPRAIELWSEAAGLGSQNAHFYLGIRYFEGDGVPRDAAKVVYHWEKAAMQGHVKARHNLGSHEHRNGNYERAVRHWLISAKMGCEKSLESMKGMFVGGIATKQQYTDALKGYQIALEEVKSLDRDVAVEEIASLKFTAG